MNFLTSLITLIITTSAADQIFVDPCMDLEECYSACTSSEEGCTYSVALNFNPNATFDDGSCLFTECISECAEDVNGDDSVTVQNILPLLSTFGLFLID